MALKRQVAVIFLISIISVFSYALPSKAMVENLTLNQKTKAEVTYFKNAYDMKLRLNKDIYHVILANVNCHNYTRTRLVVLDGNLRYLVPRSATIRKESSANGFIKSVIENNKDNLYFTPYARSYKGPLVGDIFIGNTNLNLLLMEKGFCSRL